MSQTPSFNTALLQTYTTAGLPSLTWGQSVACVLILYAYMISNKKLNWNILLLHAISGFFGTMIEGTMIENTFIAKGMCCPTENWAILLGLNEICWIVHESTTVIYSLVKLETVIINQKIKLGLRAIMGLLFIGFCVFRIQIGVLRVANNTTGNKAIGVAHANAFIFWGLADLIIFGLLVWNAQAEISKYENSQTATLFMVLMQSSVPKLMIIVGNTFLIVIVGNLQGDQPQSVSDLNTFIWSVKGAYPVLF
jgi:hypothetical protein